MSLISDYRLRWQRRHELPEPEQLFRGMDAWFQSPLGNALLNTEREMLEPMLARIFGYHMLQLGCCGKSLLGESPAGHKLFFMPFNDASSRAPVASNEFLPLANESVDAVLIHHALDFTPDSHRLLREATRVVMPGGKLLIVGFNPISSWGLRLIFRWKNRLPWNARFISSARVSDWLKLLDFSIEKVAHAAYFLPIDHSKIVGAAPQMENFGKQFLGPVGAVYFIVACKQVMPLTPIVPRWPRIPRPIIVRPIGETAGVHRNGDNLNLPVSSYQEH